MANFKFNINTSEAVKFSNKLEKMHRSNFPIAVRETLNKTAFDLKQKTMPASAKKAFIERDRNFFKANSSIEKANGFDVKKMSATTGFVSKKETANSAVKDLFQQEHGGTIRHRAFIATDEARGNNSSQKVKPMNRLAETKNFINPNDVFGKNKKEKFIKGAIEAGVGGFVLSNLNKRLLLKVNKLRRYKGDTVAITEAVYTFEENRNVKVNATNFMEKASLTSAEKMNQFFKEEAERRFKIGRK